MDASLSYEIHALTARLDRAADAALQREFAISYRRFLTLFAVSLGNRSQRELAVWLGQSEPATSRMVAVLSRDGLVVDSREPGSGNRRRLQLTPEGEAIVASCGRLLERLFRELVQQSGASYQRLQRDVRQLLRQLSTHPDPTTGGAGAA